MGYGDVRVWQDESVLAGTSILDVLKLQEADVLFAFKIFIKSFASFSRNLKIFIRVLLNKSTWELIYLPLKAFSQLRDLIAKFMASVLGFL